MKSADIPDLLIYEMVLAHCGCSYRIIDALLGYPEKVVWAKLIILATPNTRENPNAKRAYTTPDVIPLTRIRANMLSRLY